MVKQSTHDVKEVLRLCSSLKVVSHEQPMKHTEHHLLPCAFLKTFNFAIFCHLHPFAILYCNLYWEGANFSVSNCTRLGLLAFRCL